MTGNATFRHRDVALLAVVGIEAPVVVPSTVFDERLAPTLQRLRLPRGLLSRVAGVHERRWWDEEMTFDDAATAAGAKALAEAGIDAGDVGLLINTSVTRTFLEPSVASRIHSGLSLPSSALGFDLTNACLGFVNGMTLAAQLIDSGQVRYAVIVNGEDPRPTQEATLDRLTAPGTTREQFLEEFATLTLGAGAAAAVLGPAHLHPGAHRLVGGVARSATQHHELCVGGVEGMKTDPAGLLAGGLELVVDAWNEAQPEWDWAGVDRIVTHQVSSVHTGSIVDALGLDVDKVPTTFPRWGNVGPAALPMTLAAQADSLRTGDRVLCMGVGSGLHTAMAEIVW
ncbi:3-oxoacyl-ACP synthase III [Cellulomonas xylanilytica]|uniref:3-oxoacyl-ACP synthase III n=1 Tax=Cellulomonas xylanilytica TaxID=233583 RepID=A0A510V3X1_9CELL|nr:3-oxoacyl-ACP synthase III [Cellulomonas xylanilytica]GEK20601.1 3-oxoacyl-ACP synthase III [Cellulomonas xylanilytica]